jgi:hypothetical protein
MYSSPSVATDITQVEVNPHCLPSIIIEQLGGIIQDSRCSRIIRIICILASEGFHNKMKLSSFCLYFVLLNEPRFTSMNQYKFRFEEFELMEYSLQLSLHTITLKDGFF